MARSTAACDAASRLSGALAAPRASFSSSNCCLASDGRVKPSRRSSRLAPKLANMMTPRTATARRPAIWEKELLIAEASPE